MKNSVRNSFLLIIFLLFFVSLNCKVASEATIKKYQKYCSPCHSTGAGGAPLIGEPEAWSRRLKKGYSVLLKSVKEGRIGMPPMGNCNKCTDTDLISMIKYISQ